MNHEHKEPPSNISSETIVVTTEQGVVMTGNSVQAFEARIMASIRKPFFIMGFVLTVFFVILVGFTLALSSLRNTVGDVKTTVNHTDKIAQQTTSPEAQAKQAQVVTGLLSQMNCQDQRNLQRLVDNLVDAGMSQLRSVAPLVDANCK